MIHSAKMPELGKIGELSAPTNECVEMACLQFLFQWKAPSAFSNGDPFKVPVPTLQARIAGRVRTGDL